MMLLGQDWTVHQVRVTESLERESENKLSKLAHGYLPDNNDNASRTGLDSSLGKSY